MLDLRQQLRRCLRGRVCLVGVGQAGRGDDAFGLELISALAPQAQPDSPGEIAGDVLALWAGSEPERRLGFLADGGFDDVVFLDAAQFGGRPGSVVFLDAGQMASRFPQVSTHRLSLGLLARLIEARGPTRAWLLGVQPETLAGRPGLSPAAQQALVLLAELLRELIEERNAAAPGRGWPRKTLGQEALC